MTYFLYIILGLLPSFIWLLFYLRKDKKPEPNTMILRIFIWGMAIAPLIVLVEALFVRLLIPSATFISILSGQYQAALWQTIIIASLVPAVSEEYFKYAIVKTKILSHSVFDEPTDAMLYCVISGLGFAAVENLLAVFNFSSRGFGQIVGVLILRFLGATLLHAIASATVGYYLALGILRLKRRKFFIFKGLTLAIVFHSCYNYLVFSLREKSAAQQQIIAFALAVLLVGVAFFVSEGFHKLKKEQSICDIN